MDCFACVKLDYSVKTYLLIRLLDDKTPTLTEKSKKQQKKRSDSVLCCKSLVNLWKFPLFNTFNRDNYINRDREND